MGNNGNALIDKFCLSGRTAIITGGAGLLGMQHAEALCSAGANCILVDIDKDRVTLAADKLADKMQKNSFWGIPADITKREDIQQAVADVVGQFGSIDILINNAAINPQMRRESDLTEFSRFENFLLEQWNQELAVGLTGAFLCSQIVGSHMAQEGKGVILNIASDLAVIAPDQRIYKQPNKADNEQPVKPVTYSVIKAGLVGLTRYLATYWAEKNIRVNSLSPGGVYTNQPDEFVQRLTNLIPLGRMARYDEYQAAVLFLVSDASSYMTGTNLIVDGGRTCW